MLMYNGEPVLPVGVKHNLDKDESKEQENRGDGDEEQSFDLNFFNVIISSATKVRTTIAYNAADNIKAADKGVATLKNASGVTFNKYNIVQLKNTTFKEQMANQNQHQMKICTFLESCTRRNC